ncbi:MAG: hypothetical protein AAB014_00895 [Nitrospirota bacterium]
MRYRAVGSLTSKAVVSVIGAPVTRLYVIGPKALNSPAKTAVAPRIRKNKIMNGDARSLNKIFPSGLVLTSI